MEGLFEHLRPRRKGRESVFCVRMAGIPIGIKHRYSYIRRLCAGYITQDTPLFTVCASDQDLIREAGPGRSDSPADAPADAANWTKSGTTREIPPSTKFFCKSSSKF